MSSGGAKADDGAPAPAPEEPPVREPRVLPCVLAEFFSWVVVFEDACDALAELTAAHLSYEAIELALLAPQEAEAEQLYAMHNALLRKAMPKHRAKRVTRQAWCEEVRARVRVTQQTAAPRRIAATSRGIAPHRAETHTKRCKRMSVGVKNPLGRAYGRHRGSESASADAGNTANVRALPRQARV